MSHLRIVPLGGLGEVGMNCLAIETPAGVLVVDCGVTFPHLPRGIDIVHPDFRYLWERRDAIAGIVVTHGHEDHIGALPYLLRMVPVPVWAPPYAAKLVANRLAEHRDVPPIDIRVTTPRERFHVGPFAIEPLRVTHSIPDATALCIDTPAGRVLHTGDFKIEQGPLDDQPTDEERFRALGAEGVDVLLSDSTNVDVEGEPLAERDVADALLARVKQAAGRVIVGVFASNIFRLQSIVKTAQRTDRRVCLLGRSIQTHSNVARELGRWNFPLDLFVAPEQAMSIRPAKLLVIATGTQAEPNAALSRLARNDHPNVKLEKGDTVILSSRSIPGNERAVADVVDVFERRGIDVAYRETDRRLHASDTPAEANRRG